MASKKRKDSWTKTTEYHQYLGEIVTWEKNFFGMTLVIRNTKIPESAVMQPWMEIPPGYSGWIFLVIDPIREFWGRSWPIKARLINEETDIYPGYWGTCEDPIVGQRLAEEKAKEIYETYKEFR